MSQAVRIVDYDPQWVKDFEEEKQRILSVIGPRVAGLEHIGSTAVPGLGGKPIVDILVGVNNATEAETCLPPLKTIGYADVTPEPQAPDWHYCLGKSPVPSRPSFRYVHLHLVTVQSPHWEKHVLFRDYLRRSPAVAHAYFDLKKRLASRYGSDREGYTDAKTAFIEQIITHARNVTGSHV